MNLLDWLLVGMFVDGDGKRENRRTVRRRGLELDLQEAKKRAELRKEVILKVQFPNPVTASKEEIGKYLLSEHLPDALKKYEEIAWQMNADLDVIEMIEARQKALQYEIDRMYDDR